MKAISLIVLILAMSCSGQVWRVPSSFKGGTKWQLGEESTLKTYQGPAIYQRTYTPGRFEASVQQTPFHRHTAIPPHTYAHPGYLSRTYGQPALGHTQSLGTVGKVNVAQSRWQKKKEFKQFPKETAKYRVTDTRVPLQETHFHQDQLARFYLPLHHY